MNQTYTHTSTTACPFPLTDNSTPPSYPYHPIPHDTVENGIYVYVQVDSGDVLLPWRPSVDPDSLAIFLAGSPSVTHLMEDLEERPSFEFVDPEEILDALDDVWEEDARLDAWEAVQEGEGIGEDEEELEF